MVRTEKIRKNIENLRRRRYLVKKVIKKMRKRKEKKTRIGHDFRSIFKSRFFKNRPAKTQKKSSAKPGFFLQKIQVWRMKTPKKGGLFRTRACRKAKKNHVWRWKITLFQRVLNSLPLGHFLLEKGPKKWPELVSSPRLARTRLRGGPKSLKMTLKNRPAIRDL